jgi:acyl-CoA hydrolase
MPTPTDTLIENRFRMQPHHANNYGTAHGGEVMRLMDEIGAMSAMRFAGEPCVTASVADLDFEHPIDIGRIALVQGYVYDAGRTSVRVRLQVESENPRTGDTTLTNSSRFVFVAIDEGGSPVPVPDLTVDTDRDRELREQARAEEGA